MSNGPSRSFARNVVVLASGTAGGQAIAVLVSPLLSRLYPPAAFGTFGVYLAIVSILAVGAALRYEAALPLPAEETEAADLLALTLVTTIGLTVVVALGSWLALAVFGDRLSADLHPLVALLPVGFLLTGVQQVLTFWAIRRQAFGASAQSSIAQGGTQAASQVVAGAISASSIGLAIGYILARSAGSLRLAPTVERVHREALRGLSVARLRAVARRYDRFPRFALWSSLLSAVSIQTPVLMLAALFDATVVGWFSITIRVLQLPSNVIGLAVGQVFYARVSRAEPSDVTRTSAAMFRALLPIGAGPMWLLLLGGQYAFSLVFGDAWGGAGLYAQYLAPWLVLDFVSAPLTPLAYVRDRQPALLAYQIGLLVARLTALGLGAAIGGADTAMALYAATSAILVGGYLVWLLRVGGVGSGTWLPWVGRELVVGFVLVAPATIATLIAAPTAVWLVAAVVSLVAIALRAYRVVAFLPEMALLRGAA
jgi:O-antigen/teichoic acid export membrane protein